jgi:D-glycero-alpha-D-manno-heptose-7-phosphate kinase
MKQVTVRVPLRVDLAGGTLDLWPLYLFHPGSRTVNLAISSYAEVEVATRADAAIEVNLTDAGHHRIYDSASEMRKDEHVALIATIIEHFRLTGISVVTRTDAPRGSGLGGSSAIAVATVRASAEIAGVALEPDELIALARDLETRLLGIPAGVQDYYPAVYGGLTTLHLEPGRVARHPIPILLPDLASHLTVFYSGIAHFSGTNNWQIYKRHLDGDASVIQGLGEIALAAADMEKALEARDFAAAGEALGREWRNRRALFTGVTTPEIDKAIVLAVGAGAWAGKICGAGGGGCVVFLHPSDRRRNVHEALSRLQGRVLDVSPVGTGMAVETPDLSQKSFSFAPRRRSGGVDETEHLFLASESREPRNPFVLVEAVLTYDDPRRQFHHRVERTYLAPIVLAHETVDWSAAEVVAIHALALSADPPADVDLVASVKDDRILAILQSAEERAREHLVETERLTVYENPAFELFSEADEAPAAFLLRCTEFANEMLEQRVESLEATFRRRIDQIRERSDKDQRESEARDAEAGLTSEPTDVTRGAGQTLYNITSGKGTGGRSAASTAEADFLEKIALVQKAWDKELEEARVELSAQAEDIEAVSIAPAAKNVEIARMVVVWK